MVSGVDDVDDSVDEYEYDEDDDYWESAVNPSGGEWN